LKKVEFRTFDIALDQVNHGQWIDQLIEIEILTFLGSR